MITAIRQGLADLLDHAAQRRDLDIFKAAYSLHLATPGLSLHEAEQLVREGTLVRLSAALANLQQALADGIRP